ncbi:hypothetical protein ACGFZQ_24620 [Streptomyces sp. NPDC048254]|uniref:hypothetical protein n=1 Tax=Streptomyces sp. NPDC048254 TaxID=3365525 RepID=UPI003710C54B
MTTGALPLRLDTSRTCYLYAAIASSVMGTLGHVTWLEERMLATRGWYNDHGEAYTDFPRLGEYRDVLTEELFRQHEIPDSESAAELIVESIRAGRYLTVFLDRSQLGPFFGRQLPSFPHEILIFGVDADREVVHSVDYDAAGRLAICRYPLGAVAAAMPDVQRLSAPGDVLYVAQALSPGEPPVPRDVTRAAAAVQAFAEAAVVHPGAVQWWQPADLHPVQDAEYLYGCDVIDQRLCLDDAFSSADMHLQNVQLVLEQAVACRKLIARYIGAASCPVLAAHDQVVQEMRALKMSVLAHRLKGLRLRNDPRPDRWKAAVQRSCAHFAEVVEAAAGENDPAALARSHALGCRPGVAGQDVGDGA